MSDLDTLHAWYEQRLVGRLWRDPGDGAIGFRYDPEWIKGGGFPISLSLPLSAGEFPPEREGSANRFFGNLLPEGPMRERIVWSFKVSDTDFNLLRAIGGECAGALSILPVDRQPDAPAQWNYQPLTDEDLAKLARVRGRIDASLPEGIRPRLSLAGFQNKCALLVQGDKYFMPQGDAPSSHILKFEEDRYSHLPAYECFTTQLAAAVGLPVVDITLCEAGGERFVQIPRYDREWDDSGNMRRLHQEDFCQAMGYDRNQKYQDGGGPSFAQCYRLVDKYSSEPAMDTRRLLHWQVFNVLTGATDGHAKNLALLYLEGDVIRLAPFYDLLCTRAIEGISHWLAMYVGGARAPGMVTARSWEKLAEECGMDSHIPGELAQETAAALLENLGPVREAFAARYGDVPALQRVEQVVKKQCKKALAGR